jgi:hypothetical protein
MRLLLATALWLACATVANAQEVYAPLRGSDPQLALGVGHVQPRREEDRDDWLPRLVLTIFDAPRGKRVPLPEQWMRHAVETGYETLSIPVLEARNDGWLRLSFGWAHRDGLAAATPPLEYQTWESLFTGGAISPLYFRARVRHALRATPSTSAPLVAWIPADPVLYAIEPLSLEGDWARVRVSVPSDFCAAPDAPKPEVREGWIRWRDARGPWLWYYTRGC